MAGCAGEVAWVSSLWRSGINCSGFRDFVRCSQNKRSFQFSRFEQRIGKVVFFCFFVGGAYDMAIPRHQRLTGCSHELLLGNMRFVFRSFPV